MDPKCADILIIDDDTDIVEMWTEMLSNEGYTVNAAGTGAQAIQMSNAKLFNLYLIDIVLPDMPGTELLLHLKNIVPKIRKVMITGNATLSTAIAAVNWGADAYIEKPIKSQDLLKIIEEQLQRQQEEQMMTGKKIAEYMETRKAELRKTIVKSLDAFWGKTTTEAVIHHIGGEKTLEDPHILEEQLRKIFEQKGAESILKYILTYLEGHKEASFS